MTARRTKRLVEIFICLKPAQQQSILAVAAGCMEANADMIDPTVRRCRNCGCTRRNGCIDQIKRISCHWIGEDLCSFCKGAP